MLPTTYRLNLAKSFRILKKEGQSLATSYFTVLYRFGGQGQVKAGFVVSNKVGGSVVRNHFRRQLRELVHHHLDILPDGLEMVLIARPQREEPTYEKLSLEFDKILPKLSSRLHS